MRSIITKITFLILSSTLILFAQKNNMKTTEALEFMNKEIENEYLIDPYEIYLNTLNNNSQNLNKIFSDDYKTKIIREETEDGYLKELSTDTYVGGIIYQHNYDGLLYGNPFLLTYSYDVDGKILKRDGYQYDMNGKKYIFFREIYSYNNDDNLAEVQHQRENNNSWLTLYKINYFYENSINPVYSIISNPEGANWIETNKKEYFYDENNNLLESIYYQSDYQGGWNKFSRNLIEYNTDNLRTVRNYQRWNGTEWENSSKYTYSYDENGEEYLQIRSYWYNNEWVFDYQRVTSITTGKFIKLVTPVGLRTEIAPGDTLYINNMNLGVENVNIELSKDNGTTWSLVAQNIPSELEYAHKMPDEINTQLKIRISDSSDPTINYYNTEPFTMVIPTYEFLTHNTGNIEMSIFSNGYFGSDGSWGTGFKFQGMSNALFSGGLYFGIADTGASGMIGSFNIEDLSSNYQLRDFTTDDNFDERSYSIFEEVYAPYNYGVSIQQRSYAKEGDNHIYINYTIDNTNGWRDLDNFYVGQFADWDIGDATQNLGGCDESRNMIYQYENNGSSDPNYYGIVALEGMSGGFATVSGSSGVIRTEAIDFISNKFCTDNSVGDVRSFIGSGPFNINYGKKVDVCFAILAGTDLENLKANADIAISNYNNGVVGFNEKSKLLPENTELFQNYPNPFNPTTTISFSIPNSGQVSLKVYDVLGREVVTLVNENKNAGSYSVEFDGSDLVSGIYFYQLQGGEFTETKKLILLK